LVSNLRGAPGYVYPRRTLSPSMKWHQTMEKANLRPKVEGGDPGVSSVATLRRGVDAK
jgi:hypothetical protein